MTVGMWKAPLLALALLLPPLSADGEQASPAEPPPIGPDYEIAREAVERGEILPLAEVLAILGRSHPGRVIDVELEYGRDHRAYEVELITADGRLIEVEIDAVSGTILEVDEDGAD